jgi:hypothetical protein
MPPTWMIGSARHSTGFTDRGDGCTADERETPCEMSSAEPLIGAR